MPVLFLVDGAFGEVKQGIVDFVTAQQAARAKVAFVRKYSYVPGGSIDLNISVDLEQASETDCERLRRDSAYFSYELPELGGGKQIYFIEREELRRTAAENDFTFLFVRSVSVIDRICDDIGNISRVVPVYIVAQSKELSNRQTNQERQQLSEDRRRAAWDDFLAELSQNPRRYSLLRYDSYRPAFQANIKAFVDQHRMGVNREIWITERDRAILPPAIDGDRDWIIKYANKYNEQVFLMISSRKALKKRAKAIVDNIRTSLSKKGLEVITADAGFDGFSLSPTTHNPLAILHCCKYGVAVFLDDFPDCKCAAPKSCQKQCRPVYSPSIVFELAIMFSQGKKVIALKHVNLGENPLNLQGVEWARFRTNHDIVTQVDAWLESHARTTGRSS